MEVSSFYKHISQSWKWFSLPKDLKCQSSFILEWLQGKKVIVLTSCSLFSKSYFTYHYSVFDQQQYVPRKQLWLLPVIRRMIERDKMTFDTLSIRFKSEFDFVLAMYFHFSSYCVFFCMFSGNLIWNSCWNTWWGSVTQCHQSKYCRDPEACVSVLYCSLLEKVRKHMLDFTWVFVYLAYRIC